MHGPTVVRVLVLGPEWELGSEQVLEPVLELLLELVLERVLELGQVSGLGAGNRFCAIYVQLNTN